MTVRAARGAITVDQDGREAVLSATERLLAEMLERNGLGAADIISIVFTATDDVRSTFPAEAARRMGLRSVPLLCARELAVDGSLPGCIRVLMHFHTDRAPEDVAHVYLEGARSLRDDLG
ncbi:MAG: chorismate mutase [Actinomycetota bacterium]|nr:chorismate mutase [Actinomycetota bacterium]